MSEQELPAIIKNPIDDVDFGNLIELPKIYVRSLIRVNNAKDYSASVLAPAGAVDITTVDALEMETLMEPVRELRVLAADAMKEIQDDRMPHTRKMDAIKSVLIALEKDFEVIGNDAKAMDTQWETEKIRRQRVANIEAQAKINKANERATITAALTNHFNAGHSRLLISEMSGMRTAYYAKGADNLTEYGEALKEWTPEMDGEMYSGLVPVAYPSAVYHSTDELDTIIEGVAEALRVELYASFTATVTAERDRLIDLIPSRINELNTVAPEVAQARIDKEAAAITETVVSDLSSKAEVVDMQAQNDRLNAVLQNAPEVVTAPTSKGTRVKQKYQITAHTAFPPIISNWVKNHLAHLTVDEAIKKLSFMITAANADLNKPDAEIMIAKGLTTVEDIQTTTRRKAVEA